MVVVDRLVDWEIAAMWTELERQARLVTIYSDVSALIDEAVSIKRTSFLAEHHKKDVWLDYIERRVESNIAQSIQVYSFNMTGEWANISREGMSSY
jgi:hypothetical protein